MAEERIVPNYVRNLVAFTGGTVSFLIGFSLTDPNTVLPAFARELTSSALLIGLIATIQSGSWLLPQLIAANYVANKERKTPYIIWPCVVGRPMYLILAVVTFFFAAKSPLLALLTLYVTHSIFFICDGLANVPWFDVLAKALPGRRRGRYLSLSQVLGGILSVGAGALVRRILDPATGPVFPVNYSLLFGIAVVFYIISSAFMLLLKEPVESAHAERLSWRRYFAMLVSTLRDDQRYRQVIIARLLVGLGSMAVPFFILYGTDALGLGAAIVGVCLTTQIVGRIFGGLVLGFGVEKLGNQPTLVGALFFTSLGPLLAVAVSLFRTTLHPTVLLYAYAAIFFFIGISMNTIMWAFSNYILDIAPPKDRSTYIGLTNTISGLLIAAPLLGGAILEWGSYLALFVVALVIYLLALVVVWRLPRAEEVVANAEAAVSTLDAGG